MYIHIYFFYIIDAAVQLELIWPPEWAEEATAQYRRVKQGRAIGDAMAHVKPKQSPHKQVAFQ